MRCVSVDAVHQVITETDVRPDDFAAWCRGVVGGYFEVIRLPINAIDLWIDEEGKYKGYASNEWATAAAFHGKAGLEPWDFIMGNVVATGGVDEVGNTLGLTDEQLAWLRKVMV